MTEREREVPSLGGAVGLWIQRHIAIPDGERMGEPYLLTAEQWTFLLNFYRLDDRGGFVHRRGGLLVRPAKWGKSPFAAAVIAAEAAGPTRFAGWDSKGEPIGQPPATPWIQVCAVSESQTGNVYRALVPMLQLGDVAHEVEDVGLTRIVLPGGGRIEPVTAAHRSRVGARTTFAVFDELGFWTPSNHGPDLADAVQRNLAGMRGRFFGITNAWALNESSVAERIAGEGGEGVYVDDVDHGPGSIRNKAERRKMLRRVYGSSASGCEAQGAEGYVDPWIDLDLLDDAIGSLLDRDEAQAWRFYLNGKRAAESAAFNIERFRTLANPAYTPADGSLIVIGVDGARSRDALGVVATEVETGFQWPLAIQSRPVDADADYEHDLHAVDGAVVDAFERFRVARIYIDPQYIEPLIEKWEARWGEGKLIAWYTNKPRLIAHAVRRYAEAITTGELSHDGDPVLTEHVRHATRQLVSLRDDDGQPMWTIVKDGRNSPRKIDAAMAAVMSWEARYDARRGGLDAEPRKLRGAWFGGSYSGPELPEEVAAIMAERRREQ